MTDVLYAARQVILVATALVYSVVTVMALVTLPRTVQRKCAHQEHSAIMKDQTPDHIKTMTAGMDHSPIITDVDKEDTAIGQGDTTIPPCQKLQQLSEACILLPIPPLQQLIIPIFQRFSRWPSCQDTPHQHNWNSFMTYHSSCQSHSPWLLNGPKPV